MAEKTVLETIMADQAKEMKKMAARRADEKKRAKEIEASANQEVLTATFTGDVIPFGQTPSINPTRQLVAAGKLFLLDVPVEIDEETQRYLESDDVALYAHVSIKRQARKDAAEAERKGLDYHQSLRIAASPSANVPAVGFTPGFAGVPLQVSNDAGTGAGAESVGSTLATEADTATRVSGKSGSRS